MSPKILIIDDQAPLAEAMAKLLARYGLEADVSLDGAAGLSRYAAVPYDLLIVDLQLPKLSGVELIRRIRSTHRGKTLPIVIVTGVYKGMEYAAKARSALGIKFYLEKPFKQEEFLQAIRESLAASLTPKAAPAAAATPAAKEAGTAPRPAAPLAGARAAPAPPAGTERAPARAGAQEKPMPAPGHAPAHAAQPPPSPPGPKAVAEIQPQKAVRGNLRERSFDSILLEARKHRAVGTLYLKRNGEERRLLFLNGMPADVRSSKADSSFGAWLFGQGRISLMEYQVYQNQKGVANPDELFIKMGCMRPEDYFNSWRQYLEESLIQVFGWAEAEFIFQLWPRLPSEAEPQALNLPHVIHQGYKKHFPAPRAAAVFQQVGNKFPALLPGFYDHQMHLLIEPAESLFLDQVEGLRPLRELLPHDPAEAEKVMRTLGAFLALGMLELRDLPEERPLEAPFPIRERQGEAPRPEEHEEPGEPCEPTTAPAAKGENFDDLMDDLEDSLDVMMPAKSEPPKPAPVPAPAAAPAAAGAAPAAPVVDEQAQREMELTNFLKTCANKNYYEYFGMKPGKFDFPKLKSEYFRLTKMFSPEHFIMSSGEMLSQAEEALTRVATAYNTLSNVISKEKYDEMLAASGKAAGVPGAKDQDKMQAEVAFQSGLAFLEMSDWDGAEKSLGEASSLSPDNAEILAHYAYAVFNKNRKSKSGMKRAHDLLSRALKLKPKCAPAFAYRGVLFLEEEKAALAEADFKKALAFNPRYKLALKGLKRIEELKQSEKKGIFSRLMK
jgi:CheY-like chemotaxis protein